MEYHIIVNPNIYKIYKDEIINLNLRLFCDDNYSNIQNYKDTTDLLGIINYLPYTEKIYIESGTTFLDYINILLVLNFLQEHLYCKDLTINYYNIYEKNYKKAIFSKITLKQNDYQKINSFVTLLKNKKELPLEMLKIPGSINFINFHNKLIDKETFMSLIADDIEKFDGNVNEIASYLENRYSQFSLPIKFYVDYLGGSDDEI